MQTLADINWKKWIPQERATLLFVVRDGRILLIHKKRGLGAGNINGPGGRLEPGESPRQAAIREVQEELCVTPLDVTFSGELFFQFIDGFSIHCSVYRAADCEGTPQETDEAIPHWTPTNDIPYDRMWADDIHWLPLLLQNNLFAGYFLFDNTTMLDYRVDPHPVPHQA